MKKGIKRLISEKSCTKEALTALRSLDASVSGEGLPKDLAQMYAAHDGFRAYGGSLWIYPLSRGDEVYRLTSWNDAATWKANYPQDIERAIFFGCNAFGDQFGVIEGAYGMLDAETGQFEAIGATLDEWAEALMADSEFHLGTEQLAIWEQANERLRLHHRIVPKVPFVMGGSYDVNNYYAMELLSSLLLRGAIADQIYHLPDGAQVRFETNGD